MEMTRLEEQEEEARVELARRHRVQEGRVLEEEGRG